GERVGRASRLGAASRENGQAANAEFLGGRNRNSSGRGADDAVGRGSGVCRLGDFQIERSGETREGDCVRDDELSGCEESAGSVGRTGRGDEGTRRPADGREGSDADARMVRKSSGASGPPSSGQVTNERLAKDEKRKA